MVEIYDCSCIDFEDFITICVPQKVLIMSFSNHCCIIVAEFFWLYWQQLLKSPCFNRSWFLRSFGFCNNSISWWSWTWPRISTLPMASRGHPQFIWSCFVSLTWVFLVFLYNFLLFSFLYFWLNNIIC